MDLSTGGNLDEIRKLVIERSSIPLGTVPIYEAAAIALKKYGDTNKISADLLFDVIEKQCEQGVDFITVHCGVTQEAVRRLKFEKRILSIVSNNSGMDEIEQ